MKRRAYFIAILCCAGSVASVFAQSDGEFSKANQEFAQGHFKEAITGYEAVVRAGRWNANLFYDLGNAYFRAHDFGHAILNYERALASRNRGVDPNSVDAETAAETFKLDTDSRDRLRRLFEQNDEWQYSGTHNGPGSVSPENRRDVLELIDNLK